MDRRRAVTLIIICMITLIVTITGASYAYFSSSFGVNNSAPVDARTDAASPSFMSTSSGSIDINVEDYLMREESANNENSSNQLSDEANLSIFLTSAKDKVVSTCTYDIIFVWNDDADEYKRTEGALREFTISGSAETDADEKKPTDDVTSKDKFEVSTTGVSEKNIDTLDWQTKDTIEVDGEKEVKKTIKYAVLVKDAKISSAYLRNATAVNWTFKIKFYNIKMNQNNLKGKNYSGMIRVDQDSIKC